MLTKMLAKNVTAPAGQKQERSVDGQNFWKLDAAVQPAVQQETDSDARYNCLAGLAQASPKIRRNYRRISRGSRRDAALLVVARKSRLINSLQGVRA
jgi:hypothetical protein